MNGFSDVHVAFGESSAPTRGRLNNLWRGVADPPAGMWLGTSEAEGRDSRVGTGSASGWRLWAVGDLYGYRGDPGDVLGRLAADLADNTADPGQLDAHAVVFAWEVAARGGQ